MFDKKTCIEIKQSEFNKDDFEFQSQLLYRLMPFKVREILLVSSLYDAFIIEQEGLISEMVIEEYRHLLLSSPPRVTRVASGKKAIDKIREKKYDLVITMSKNIGMDPYNFGKKIKKECPGIPVIILATDAADLYSCQKHIHAEGIDRAFFWNGDSRLFLAIIKNVEDAINAPYDIKNADVRIIILIEDSIRFYSMFLPIIYTEVVRQTQRSISDDYNEMQRLLRRRARPKILLIDSFEKGMDFYRKYKDNVLSVISDVKFYRNNALDSRAGYDFIKLIKQDNRNLPVLLQSIDSKNRKEAERIGAFFIHKNSPSLLRDFDHFLLNHLGFGDFVFLLPKETKRKELDDIKMHQQTKEIARASNMEEFENKLQKVPLKSIEYHSNRNDFSNWLMARAEFKLAIKLRPQKISDFNSIQEHRSYLIDVFNERRRERQLGVIADFSQQSFEFDSSFTKIGEGSLGGKGRGIAFIRSMLARYGIQKKYPETNIIVPNSLVIGTEIFDKFIEDNDLYKFKEEKSGYDNDIANAFLKAKLSDDVLSKLKKILKQFKSPLAIRSSSLLEDSQNFPFAGIYSTYMIPNNHKTYQVRLQQLCQAIKLVYASVFYKEPRSYIKSISSKIEEEKMAVIIQEMIGEKHNGRFYPTISGLAQSYNFYPVSYQDRKDGIVSVAVGLGHSVVGGENTLRFSPKYPEIIPEFSSPENIIENTQRKLYVLNTKNSDVNLSVNDTETLKKIEISDIAKDGTLNLVTSSFDRNDWMIRDVFSDTGPYLITFAGVLKYDIFPLASIVQTILKIFQKAMGCPVEIEFAVVLPSNLSKKPTFALLQVRPLILTQEHQIVKWNLDEIDSEKIFIKSDRAMGNGIIESIRDIIFISPNYFDPSKTIQMAEEIEQLNREIQKPYVLLGPGRWGTADRWLGVPVKWHQISKVKIMIETAIENFNIKPTQGTHFFQNIISRGIGYLSTSLKPKDSIVDWKWLNQQKVVKQNKFVKHVELEKPLKIYLDGKSGSGLILKP
jgi:CheY-like chemotaxis protein